MELKAWLIGMPNWMQKHSEESADVLTQPVNQNSADTEFRIAKSKTCSSVF